MTNSFDDTFTQLLQQLEKLDRGSLLELKAEIVDRLKTMDESSQAEQLRQFSVGDRVSFENKSGETLLGSILRVNKKTLTLVTDDDMQWRVSPNRVSLMTPPLQNASVVPLKQGIQHSTSPNTEWVGGIVEMTPVLSDEGIPERISSIMWVDQEGMVQGVQIYPHHEVMQALASDLEATLNNPGFGDPVLPTRIRVSDPDIADALSGHFPQIEIAVGPTPEFDAMAQEMLETLSSNSKEPPGFLEQNLAPERISPFFSATAGLYKAKPWNVAPSDDCLFSLSIPALQMHDAIVCIIGQAGMEFAVLVFESQRDYESYRLAGEYLLDDRIDDFSRWMPKYRALNFVPGKELTSAIRKEITANHWTVANSQAYPALLCSIRVGVLRELVDDDLMTFEILSEALVKVLKNPKQLLTSWEQGQPCPQSFTIETGDEAYDIELTSPPVLSDPDNLIQVMANHFRRSYEPDWDELESLAERINEKFRASSEYSEGGCDGGTSDIVMHFLLNYTDNCIATALPSDLAEVLFGIVPRKVMAPPSEAPVMIRELRVFYQFLKREFGLVQADACLELLTDDAIDELRESLGDPSKAGIGKSLLMGNEPVLPPDLPLFDTPPEHATKKTANPAKRKKKRKQAKQARKKNR